MKVSIIGAGASGMMTAVLLKQNNIDCKVYERNDKIMKKIYATGNGRCNFTNVNLSYKNFHGKNPKFTLGALNKFDNKATVDFFNQMGIVEVELEDGKLFPQSLQASSIVRQFELLSDHLDLDIDFNSFVSFIEKKGDKFYVKANGKVEECDALVLATGSKTYPKSGSDGNGYRLSKKLGHSITEIHPGIVQLRLKGDSFEKMSGTKFRAKVTLLSNGKKIKSFTQEVLFTDYGISGPAILQVSGEAIRERLKGAEVLISIDLLYDQSLDEVFSYLIYQAGINSYKSIADLMVGLINDKLIGDILKQASIDEVIKAGELSNQKLRDLSYSLKNFNFEVESYKDDDSGQVTCGGVATDEIDPKTMGSKLVKNLYIVGELMDIDGDCGGYNLQWAWSSAYSCAKAISYKENFNE
ncbi:MAG: NAD(P)/FAD-dependent oxidoreductase [Finegoldia sp.]|nr:NAD(P)/FAD-dependent oxidoreductase [Finegoldia sp.]